MESPTARTPRVPLAGNDAEPVPPVLLTPDPFGAAPAPAPRPRFRLRRSRADRMVGGVCGGLAESLDVDATLLRLGLVALTVFGSGFGLVLYVSVWAIAPATDTP